MMHQSNFTYSTYLKINLGHSIINNYTVSNCLQVKKTWIFSQNISKFANTELGLKLSRTFEGIVDLTRIKN